MTKYYEAIKYKRIIEVTTMLKIKANLLPWYNELSDIVDVDQNGFPKEILSKIVAFGDCKLDYIDEKEAHFLLKSSSKTPSPYAP
jgi:hypothetical protein